MDLRRVPDPAAFVGQRLPFKLLEYGEGGRNIILSRRAILEEEQGRLKETLKETLKEGMTVRGPIVSIRDFGAFVDLGGVHGLLPISEVSWERVQDIRDHLSVGQEVDVNIVQLDWEKDRVTLSLKQTLPDPWDTVEGKYPDGSVHAGKVVRLTPFGAFVSLEAGVDGLIHISKLGAGKRIRHPSDVVNEGQTIEVKVEALDREKKRISLSLAGTDRGEGPGEEAEDYRKYTGTGRRSGVTLGDLIKDRTSGKGRKARS
jgi:small subunit ribosomal protein S1